MNLNSEWTNSGPGSIVAPARIGFPVKLGGLVEEYYNPIFSTGVGLVLYGAAKREVDYVDTSTSEKTFNGVWERMRGWFKEFF